MPAYSIAFIIVMLILGFLIGGVLSSLIERIFGFSFFSYKLFDIIIDDFYVIHNIHVMVTLGAFVGLVTTGFVLYRKIRRS